MPSSASYPVGRRPSPWRWSRRWRRDMAGGDGSEVSDLRALSMSSNVLALCGIWAALRCATGAVRTGANDGRVSHRAALPPLPLPPSNSAAAADPSFGGGVGGDPPSSGMAVAGAVRPVHGVAGLGGMAGDRPSAAADGMGEGDIGEGGRGGSLTVSHETESGPAG